MITNRASLFVPALLLGVAFGMSFDTVVQGIVKPEEVNSEFFKKSAVFCTTMLVIYGLLTWIVFRMKRFFFQLSPVQFRVAWISAFLLGAVGFPLLVSVM